MANRYDIIRIDFQASAKGANTAIESIRQEAEQCNNKISELKKNIAEAPKNGTDAKIVEGWNAELKVMDKRFKQFNTAYKELIKGMRALDEGVKMFNDGSLSQMNAAFQKTVNNAAKLAQSKLETGSNEWRQMGALMQETEQNYARMQRDTDQLIESLKNGGTVFRKTLDDEIKGLQDLMRILPYMGTEYRKAEEQMKFLVKTSDELIIKERQMQGEIATTNDARRVSYQLTKEGAEAARQRVAAADEEIEKGKQIIANLEEEQKTREANARVSAQAAAEYRQNQKMHEDEIERLDAEMKKEMELAKSKKNGVEALKEKALGLQDEAETEKKKQQELDGVRDTAREKVEKLRQEYEALKQSVGSAPAKDPVSEAVKAGAEEVVEVVKKEAEETKKKTTAKKEENQATKEATEIKKEEVKVEEKVVETQKEENNTVELLMAANDKIQEKIKELTAECEKLAAAQKEGALATKEEANAFADLSKEQAEAMLKQKQALSTFKAEGGKMTVTNREEAQQYLFDVIGEIAPSNVGKTNLSIQNGKEKIGQLLGKFRERYGLKDDNESMDAIRELMSGGGLIKSGFMNPQFLILEQNTAKIDAFNKSIKDLTAVINGETKAVEENVEKKKTLEEIDAEINLLDRQSAELSKQTARIRNGISDGTVKEVKANSKLAESHNQNTEAIKKEIEAIKQLTREQVKSLRDEMLTKSTVGWKANKLDASNLEQVQHWIITEARKLGNMDENGVVSLKGNNIDKLMTEFHKTYGVNGEPGISNDLFKEIIKGEGGGLFKKGGSLKGDDLKININNEAYDARLQKLEAIFEITNKIANASNNSSRTTKEHTDAIAEQEQKVKDLKQKWEEAKVEYNKYNDEYKKKVSEAKRLSRGSMDEQVLAVEKEAKADTYKETYVDPAAKRREQYRKLHASANAVLTRMRNAQSQDTDETQKNTDAQNQNTEATENNTKSKGRKKKAAEETAKATAEETQKSAELLAKEKELSDAEKELETAQKNAENQQKKTTKAVEDAEAAVTKADEADKKHVETMDKLADEQQQHKKDLQELNEANKDTIATNEKNQQLLAETNNKILEQGEKIRDAERIKAQAKTEGIEKTEKAIRLLKEENDRIDQNSFTWKRNTIEIQHLQEALDEMKGKPALMMMEQRMKNVGSLSNTAFEETKKFWQAMYDGADKGSDKLKEAEEHLKKIAEEEAARVRVKGAEAISFFNDKNVFSGVDSEGNQIFKTKAEAASAAETAEQVKALQVYRDLLPKDTDAATIESINKILEEQTRIAKELTGEWMSYDDAVELASKAGGEGFIATTQQMQQAVQAMERQRDELIKTIQLKQKDGKATADEQAQLEKLEKELKDLKFEQDNFNMSHDKMKRLLKEPTRADNLDELKAAIKRADGELHRMGQTMDKNNKEYKEFAEQVRNAKNMLKEMEGQAKASATAWEKAWSRLKTYVVMYMGFNAVWKKFMGTADDLMQLSDKMGEVRKTTGFSADEVGRLSDNLKKLDVRTPLTQLLEISAKAGQLGLKSEQDVMGFTEAANKLMIALPEMGAEAATEMMKVAIATGEVKKIQDQLNQGLIEGSSATEVALEKVGSTIDQLRANSAAAAPQITDFVKRVGAVGAQSGITIDQVAALGATVDAIGLRVEMSATALSRMIPAIRNNAFDVAKAIGMAPNALREMFDKAGGGMEAMLAIFQHIKDAGLDPDSIEKLLGMGGMQDVMKQLNQQGARAGIVFAGLSQNVDELRKNLGVAHEAYEDNIAILQEYNKMNDTTAAKWDRFKNKLEEFFVGDRTQRWLGGLITGMRTVLDLLTGSNGWAAAFRTIVLYLGVVKLNIAGVLSGVKNISVSLKGIAMTIGLIDKETKKLAWGNIFTAAAAAVLWLWVELTDLKSAVDKANEALGKTKEETDRVIDRFEGYWAKLKSTNEALVQAKASHEKLSAEVDKLRKSTDGSAESTAKLKEKEDELTKSEDSVTRASNDHKSAISQMNSIYGKYLGFILTEANYSDLAAAAHDKVTAAIKREMLIKQKQAALVNVDSEYADNIAKDYGNLYERLVKYGKLERSEAAKVMSDMQKFMRENMKYDATKNETIVKSAVINQLKKKNKDIDLSDADASEIAGLWFNQYLKDNYHIDEGVREGLSGVSFNYKLDKGWGNVLTFASNLRGDYADTYAKREQERGAVAQVFDVDISSVEGDESKSATELLQRMEKRANEAKKKILDKKISDKERNEAYGELANSLEGLENRINELDPQKDAETINRLNKMATSLKGEGIDIKKLKKAREQIHQTLFEKATFDENTLNNLDTTNPQGKKLGADSTDWKNMTAEQLVNRRKQMKDFVNAIQTDSDIQKVLGEDAALKKAIDKGMSSDMRTVVEWYNTERLKIQDELYSRHLTNTGDWKDPKKGSGSWRKQLQTDFDTYLKILDAYYTERKAKIEKAQTEEGMSEAEAQRLTIENETVWRKHRMELQKIYLGKGAEIAKEERQRIYNILGEQDEEDPKFVEKTIARSLEKMKELESKGEQGLVEYRKIESKLIKDIATDLYKQQNTVSKQMEAISKIIAEERPFDGLVENLEKNLSTMGILFAELDKKRQEAIAAGLEPEDDTRLRGQEEVNKRMLVLMQQAEDAYTLTFDKLKEVMIKEGFADWANAIENDDQLSKGMMAMLRKMYDDVHNTIKKESTQMKKELDIWWNDVEGEGKLSRKGGFEKMLSDLGLKEDQVKRANSLIGAGAASERVADKLAIQQMRVRLAMQNAYYAKMKEIGKLRVKQLEDEAEDYKKAGDMQNYELKMLDAKHAQQALNLSLSEEQKKVLEQEVAITNQLEESQNRLYKELKEWGDLLYSSVREIMEAEQAGNAEYYNERAKLNLTGNGGPGAGTYVVIEDEGTEDATAHYEYLDERQALERQHEIERENAQAEAWEKLFDDFNQKMADSITDWMNAYLQNQAVEANTQALKENTEKHQSQLEIIKEQDGIIEYNTDATRSNTNALKTLTDKLAEGIAIKPATDTGSNPATAQGGTTSITTEQTTEGDQSMMVMPGVTPGVQWTLTEDQMEAEQAQLDQRVQMQIDAAEKVRIAQEDSFHKAAKTEGDTGKQMQKSSQSTFAKMTMAANMYGVAYQAMSNDNLSTTQKFEMMALQAVGNYAIGALTTEMAAASAKAATDSPGVLGKLWKELGWAATPVFAIFTGLLGGLMGLASSKIGKAKSQIAQATGASSASAGKLTTGMLAYAEGNVNEFTDPGTLTPGRSYNVDAADGKTYRAKYTGSNPKTHITNGPEFHLVGEAGREAIIDAHTTRNIQLNEPEIWGAIKTLYNGGSLSHTPTRRRGVRAFADGNIDDFEDVLGGSATENGMGGFTPEMAMSMQASLDRNSEVMEQIAANGIEAFVSPYGPRGVVAGYDKAKREAMRHGEKYL
jgi:hypothetical protein